MFRVVRTVRIIGDDERGGKEKEEGKEKREGHHGNQTFLLEME